MLKNHDVIVGYFRCSLQTGTTVRIKRVRVMRGCLYFLAVSAYMNSEVFGHILVKGVGVESHIDEEEGWEYKHTWLRRDAGILYVGPFKE